MSFALLIINGITLSCFPLSSGIYSFIISRAAIRCNSQNPQDIPLFFVHYVGHNQMAFISIHKNRSHLIVNMKQKLKTASRILK